MNQIYLIVLALLEMVIIKIICNGVIELQYEYISIKYSEFKFANEKDRPIGLNILIQILCPTIYIIILSGIFYMNNVNLVKDIYLITIYYYFMRWFKIVFVLNRAKLYNWKEEILMCGAGTILSVFIYNIFITKTNQIFVSIDEIRDGIWVAVILFILVLIRNYIYNYSKTNSCKENSKKRIYIMQKYVEFKEKYHWIINKESKDIQDLIYAIMIYENYNRPPVVRILEKIKCLIMGNATLGIMQVYTDKIIDDTESVKLGVKKIHDEVEREKANNEYNMELVISNYNKGSKYKSEIFYILAIINDFEENI